jgi:hypothetical protein
MNHPLGTIKAPTTMPQAARYLAQPMPSRLAITNPLGRPTHNLPAMSNLVVETTASPALPTQRLLAMGNPATENLAKAMRKTLGATANLAETENLVETANLVETVSSLLEVARPPVLPSLLAVKRPKLAWELSSAQVFFLSSKRIYAFEYSYLLSRLYSQPHWTCFDREERFLGQSFGTGVTVEFVAVSWTRVPRPVSPG